MGQVKFHQFIHVMVAEDLFQINKKNPGLAIIKNHHEPMLGAHDRSPFKYRPRLYVKFLQALYICKVTKCARISHSFFYQDPYSISRVFN